MSKPLPVVYGAASLWAAPKLREPDAIQELLNLLEAHNVKSLDTARFYENSEKALGESGAVDRFDIDTKAFGGYGGPNHPATRENVFQDGKDSQALLKGKPIDIFYLHAPDPTTPLEDTLAGVNDVYKIGFFKRFGLSNFSAEDVQKAYDICKANGYPLPSVYQGRYGPVDYEMPETLLPTLRKLGIAFYAFSPIAGGLLAKSKEEVLGGKGRFDTSTFLGKVFSQRYAKPAILDLLDKWAETAKAEGVTRIELAYRWVRYHSALSSDFGDAIIIGTSSMEQTVETLAAVEKGPLSSAGVKGVEEFMAALEVATKESS